MYLVEINVNALSKELAIKKAKQAESIITNTDAETLEKVAELFAKPGACENFKKALNNPLAKALFK